MVENNLKLLLSGKFDFYSEEISYKLLLFDLKKLVKKKIFDLILGKYWTKTIFITLSIGREQTHLE